jgi:hypothetical protein
MSKPLDHFRVPGLPGEEAPLERPYEHHDVPPGPGSAPLPAVLKRQRSGERLVEFLREHSPVGPTEIAVVRDLARQAEAMERWAEAAEAAHRQTARSLPLLDGEIAPKGDEGADALLALAMAAEPVDRCDRHALAHTRSFYRSLAVLEALQLRRRRRELTVGSSPLPPAFADETACEAYLAERFRAGKFSCPACGSSHGYFLAGRRAWECGGCRLQSGLRCGTVMARSPLPLWPWFEMVRWLVWRPTIRVAALAQRIGIARLATVRGMAARVHEALAADNVSELLAGLDVYYAQPPAS